MQVLIVLPTYNEAENIREILERVRSALPEACVLVVDDGSPDGTAELAGDTAERLGQISVMRRQSKSGLGSAYRDGFAWGLERGFDVLVEMDSDFSHDPDDLGSLVGPIEEGTDVVIGSRYVPGGSIPDWSLSRRLLSRGGNLFANAVLGLGVEDSTSGFRAYSASLLKGLDLGAIRANSYGFQIEMTYRSLQAGAEFEEVPIRFVDRRLGTSKMSAYTVFEALGLVAWWGLQKMGRRLMRRTGRDGPVV
ncbi:MAG: polyprenol monophosphomannose synthase [Acidimicrobiales bacterium]